MFAVELVCSDERCAVVREALGHLSELELLVCEDCGCTFQITAVSEAELVSLVPPAFEDELPLAA